MAVIRRTRSTRLLVVSLVMASLITITVDFRGGQRGPLELAGRAALTVIGPLQDAVSRVIRPVGSFFGGLVRIGSLEEENRRLKAEIERLEQLAGSRVSTERELLRLRRLLELNDQLGVTGVAASVIGRSPSNFEWSITINVGSSEGVKEGLPVVSGEGLVGRVTQVSPHWSAVELIIDPHASVAGRLAGSGETGLLTGQRTNPLTLDLVNPDAKVVPDEQVVTSGYEGGLYPAGILIGYVSSVYTNPGSLEKSILVRPAVDFTALEVVEVVIRARRVPPRNVDEGASPSPSPLAS
jgi:rod shape-determining protein MreC